ncbi:MAG: response regulator [Alphaproteobacteria bacterium]
MASFPKRIVYVDDEPRARKVVQDAITDANAETHLITCATARELIARIRELSPDLILLDLLMPDMNGPDTIEALRKSAAYNGSPVIFVTEKRRVKMLDDYKALGVIGVIYKPLDSGTLTSQIETLWEKHRAELIE